MQLTAGANIPLPSSIVRLIIQHQSNANVEVDVTAYILSANNKVRGDADMIFYGQTQTSNRSIILTATKNNTQLDIDTNKLDFDIQKIAICITLNDSNRLENLQTLDLNAHTNEKIFAQGQTICKNRQEAALILAEVYRHKDMWKLRYVEQGFNGGLHPLAEYFGVEIEKPIPSTTPPLSAQATPKLSLSKITLNKSNSSINLVKKSDKFGRISINLNWNQNSPNTNNTQSGGFLKKLLDSVNGQNSIDLDVGAMIEYQDGGIDLVQALGNRFGSLNQPPYIQLQGDDRTGHNKEGEWLYINGSHWAEFKRIIIFTFIYEGVPNWAATDGKVTVNVPEQSPIEIALNEGRNLPMCGIVELVNNNGSIQINRLIEYFKDHSELDQHYGFGFKWKAGRK